MEISEVSQYFMSFIFLMILLFNSPLDISLIALPHLRGTNGGKKFQGGNIILGVENVAKKYLGQTLPFTNMSLISLPSQSKGRKGAGSTDNCGSSKKLPFIQE